MTAEAPTASIEQHTLGVDIGGTGIKAAPVDVRTGTLLAGPARMLTPRPARPVDVAGVVAKLVAEAGWCGRVGVTFPGVIKNGVARSAANVDPSWRGCDARQVFGDAIRRAADVVVLNDADAAGLAEVTFGAARNMSGVVMVMTFGTGIGSALIVDGQLVPNTELGHLELDGCDAETRAAASVRGRQRMSYARWAGRVSRYLRHVERLFTPDLFVVGGGVSRLADRWVPLLNVETPVRPAALRANAEIVGAALAAAR